MNILLILPGFILAVIIVVLYELKLRKPFPILSNSLNIGKNKVHFYVARDKDGTLWLYVGKPVRDEDSFVSNEHGCVITHSSLFEYLGLNINNYKDLKWEDEPVEVFLNLED